MKLHRRLRDLQTAFLQKKGYAENSVGRPPPVSMRTPADILKLLEQLTTAVQADPFAEAVTKARAAGHLAAIALKAIEVNDLAARVALLEMVLEQRPKGDKQ